MPLLGESKYISWKIINCVFFFDFPSSLFLWWKTCYPNIQLSKLGLRLKNMLQNDLPYFSTTFPQHSIWQLHIVRLCFPKVLASNSLVVVFLLFVFVVCSNTTPTYILWVSILTDFVACCRFCHTRMSSVCAAVTQAPLETSHCWLLVMFHTFLQIPRIRWGLRNFRWRGLLGCFWRRSRTSGKVFTLKMTREGGGGTKCVFWAGCFTMGVISTQI